MSAGVRRGFIPAATLLLLCAFVPAGARGADDAGWTLGVHGYAFLTANKQGTPSGDRDFSSQNHFMLTASHAFAGGTLSLLGTFTLEPATVPAQGMSELFQRGETYRGILLIDRQHPHDFFAQMAARWEKTLPGGVKAAFTAGVVGEPALGPDAYPHRLSASANPMAPLAHHNQDATHISYDVLTLGLTFGPVTLEGSGFHGAEPDENRWNIEAGRIDSYSARATVRLANGVSAQISAGHLEHPEAIEEGNQTRTTASVTFERTSPGGLFAASFIVGKNQTPDGPEWGSTLEATWKFAEKNILFGRIERVDRDVDELVDKRQRPENAPHVKTIVDAFTLGAVRLLPLVKEAETGLGAAVTFYSFDSRVEAVYGKTPVSFQVFMRLTFGSHGGGMHEGMDHSMHH